VVLLQPGMIYNLEDGRKALRDVFGMQLFDNVQVQAKPAVCMSCTFCLQLAVEAYQAH
jgi:outer membrane protein assembly factor BamA